MSLRATLLLVSIAVSLGLYVYLVEIRGREHAEQAEARAKRLLAVEPGDVTALELTTTDGKVARLVRAAEGEGWVLEAPLRFPADSAVVKDLLGTLERLAWDSTIEDPPGDLTPFGLGKERKHVRVWTGEREPSELFLGGPAPVGSAIYVARGGDEARIYTVTRASSSGLPPRLFDLRDKRMVVLEPGDVKAIRVLEWGTLVAAAEREEAEGSGWRLVEPVEDRADAERIDRLLQDLRLARATGFVDQPGPLAEYGLDAPEVEIRLETAGGTVRVQMGRVQDRAFLRLDDGERVCRTSDRLLMSVPRRVFAFRFKQVLEVDSDRVARMVLEFPRDEARHAFVREDRAWRPEEPGLAIRASALEDLLWAIEDLEATGVVEGGQEPAELGLQPPRARVRLFDEGGESLGWLELGDPLESGEGLAARSSAGERLWQVQGELGRDVPLGLEAFERNLLETPPPSGKGDEKEPAGPGPG